MEHGWKYRLGVFAGAAALASGVAAGSAGSAFAASNVDSAIAIHYSAYDYGEGHGGAANPGEGNQPHPDYGPIR